MIVHDGLAVMVLGQMSVLLDKLPDKLPGELLDKLPDELLDKLLDKLPDKLPDKLLDELLVKLLDELPDELLNKLLDEAELVVEGTPLLALLELSKLLEGAEVLEEEIDNVVLDCVETLLDNMLEVKVVVATPKIEIEVGTVVELETVFEATSGIEELTFVASLSVVTGETVTKPYK